MQFLFEKLQARPNGAGDEVERTRDAILLQLDWLVGCREWLAEKQGTALIDACMPDLPSLAANGSSLRRYAERLRVLIERYEPRLAHPKVELSATRKPTSPFNVVVSGVLTIGDEDIPLRFERAAGGR